MSRDLNNAVEKRLITMNNFYDELLDVLKQDERFFTDGGEILRNVVYEAAMQMDVGLIKLLFINDTTKKRFFTEVDGIAVFDKVGFGWVINNRQFLPDSYTRFKNKIGLINSRGEFISGVNDIELVFPYKDCVLEAGQTKEDQNRDEVFYNETLAPDEIDRLLFPKVLSEAKRYSMNRLETTTELKYNDNLIIKGNNLLVLVSLLKRYEGKIKCIYIDPPYNTGKDSFLYNDSFNHSSWLTFMKNRLEVAKKLLTKDGFLMVHCDYIEDSYLKVLMDEIFGRNKFVNSISVRDSHPSGLKLSARDKTIIKTKSTILVYKNTENVIINPVYQQRFEWDTHFNTYLIIGSKDEEIKKMPLDAYIKLKKVVSDENFILNEQALLNKEFREFAFKNRDNIFQSTKEIPDEPKEKSLQNEDVVIRYADGEYAFNGRRLSPLSKSIYNVGFDGYYQENFGKLLCDFWDDVDFNNSQSEGGVSFPSGKKPEYLIARLISMFTQKGDIVCDFHLGSGTTAAVAHKMGRQYIGVEQLDYGEDDSIVRLQNVINGDKSGISKVLNWKGGGTFVFCKLKELNQNYIQLIRRAQDDNQLGTIWREIKGTGFISSYVNPKEIDESVSEFKELSFENKKKLFFTLLDKNMLYVNLCDIEDKDFAISDDDKAFTKSFYKEA